MEPSYRNLSILINELRTGKRHLLDYLNDLENNYNTYEPSILAFIPEKRRFQRLRNEAHKIVGEYPLLETRPSLFGIPIGVKDIFNVRGFRTKAGTTIPSNQLKGSEAESVKKLKKAGSLIMGKTVTTEFAYLAPGPTRNPHNLEHTPGGSSSGSAAAVALGLCPVALGTQTIGSIIRPASFCGVVGFKPSYDRISRDGVIPLAPSIDHIGFFIKNTKGIDLLCKILYKEWSQKEAMKKPVLGVPEGPYLKHTSKKGMIHFKHLIERIQNTGFEILFKEAMTDFHDIYHRHHLILAAEAAQIHLQWFPRYKELYHPTTRDLIKRGQRISKTILEKTLLGREKLRNELMSLMDENDIDLWLSPSAPGPAPKGLESTGNSVMNLPWTHSGLPTLNLPVGVNKNGLPMGVQLTSRWYSDENLVNWAKEIEDSLQLSKIKAI